MPCAWQWIFLWHSRMPHIKGYAPHRIPIYDNPRISYAEPYHWGRKGSAYEGLFYGVKYECVEFIRRYYIQVYGVTFQEIDNADDLFSITHGIDIMRKKRVPFHMIPLKDLTDASSMKKDDIVIWKKAGPYQQTGHVAIVVEVLSDKKVRVVEQNGPTKDGERTIRLYPGILGLARLG